MSTTLSTPRLSEVARHLVIPDGIVSSAFPRVERCLNDAGVVFDPWQRGLNMVALGCREDGRFAASIGGVVVSIPRQVGKTWNFGRLLVGLCLEFPGFKSAWTSHHNRTTTNTFRSLQGLVRQKSIFPHLAPNGIRTANGEQEIRFANGSIIMFGAREQGFGRGMDEMDVLIFDEAQILTLKALEDMVPATNQARNPHGGLLFFMGTPPRPEDPGEAFTAKREQALSGRSQNMVYVEFSADPDSDPDDRSQWPKMNPSFPHRTPLEAMLRMRENIPDEDSWNREARGIWPEISVHEPIVPDGVWRRMVSTGPESDVQPTALGVDMSYRGEISIMACWVRNGFPPHLEEMWSGVNVDEAVAWLVKNGWGIPILVDATAPAAQMVPMLKAEQMKTTRVGEGLLGDGCVLFETMANDEQLTHAGQPSLTKALKGACKRPVKDAGKWRPDRKDSTSSIFPFVAAVLALLGACSIGDKSEAFFL